MSIKLGPEWKRVSEECITWPTTGKPCKEVYRNFFRKGLFNIYYNEDGKVISSNAKDFFCSCEMTAIFGNA